MVALYAAGALDKATAFPLRLDPEVVANVLLERPGLRCYPLENIELLKKMRPDDKTMINALEKQMNRPIWISRMHLFINKRIRHLKRKLKK
jgi:hypothetical protein